MNWLEEHWLRLLFMTGYLAMLAYHCWAAQRETHSLDDYLIGGRKLGGWVIALSFYATFVSTNSFVGHAGKSWDAGLIWYIKGVVIVLSCYMAWYLVAPRFFIKALEYKSLTLPDFLGRRYDSLSLRRISAIVIFMAAVLYLIAVYKGSALALQQFLGLNYQVAAVAIFLVVTAYTLAGGFRSVVLTDTVQGVLMAIGAVALMVAVLYKGGGLTAIMENIRTQDPDLVSWQGKMPIMTILGLAIAGGMKMLVDPRQISRIYGLKDKKALGVARIVSPLLIFITYLCLLPIGAFAHALIPADAINDSDLVTPFLLGTAEVLGPILSSFFLLVLLSAAMSSLDSVLLVAASSVGRDIMVIGDKDPRVLTRTRVWVGGDFTARNVAGPQSLRRYCWDHGLFGIPLRSVFYSDAGFGIVLERWHCNRRLFLRASRLNHGQRMALRETCRLDHPTRSLCRFRRSRFGLCPCFSGDTLAIRSETRIEAESVYGPGT